LADEYDGWAVDQLVLHERQQQESKRVIRSSIQSAKGAAPFTAAAENHSAKTTWIIYNGIGSISLRWERVVARPLTRYKLLSGSCDRVGVESGSLGDWSSPALGCDSEIILKTAGGRESRVFAGPPR
jgi:hypothetical protein